jgi:hypothetical protein
MPILGRTPAMGRFESQVADPEGGLASERGAV